MSFDPYIVPISEVNFQEFSNTKDIDDFLVSNYRYLSLDSLIKDLSKLSDELNKNLVSIINKEYENFIKLGNSINIGLNYINEVNHSLTKFKASTERNYAHLIETRNAFNEMLYQKDQLMLIRFKLKLVQLIFNQFTSFQLLLSCESSEIEKLRKLTMVYILINQLYRMIKDNLLLGEDSEIMKKINSSFFSTKNEFCTYVDELLVQNVKQIDPLAAEEANSDLILSLLTIYDIVERNEDVISILRGS